MGWRSIAQKARRGIAAAIAVPIAGIALASDVLAQSPGAAAPAEQPPNAVVAPLPPQAPPPASEATPAPAPPPASEAAPSPAPPSSATVLSKDDIQSVLGKKVMSATGEDMGQIVNVIVERGGQPRAVVVDFGGFLGVGSRKIAVDWNALHFAPEGKTDQVTLDLTRDQLKAAPEYKEGSPVVVFGNAGGTETLPQGDLPSTP